LRRQPAERPFGDDEQIDADAGGEGHEGQGDDAGGEALKAPGVFPLLGDAMERGRRDDQHHHHEHQGQRHGVERRRQGAEALEARLEAGAVLEAEQHLRSQHQHAGLVQRVLDFILEAARVLGFGRAIAGARAFGGDGCHISETLRIVRRCRWRAASFARHRDQCVPIGRRYGQVPT
jgi:hypothetical protein